MNQEVKVEGKSKEVPLKRLGDGIGLKLSVLRQAEKKK